MFTPEGGETGKSNSAAILFFSHAEVANYLAFFFFMERDWSITSGSIQRCSDLASARSLAALANDRTIVPEFPLTPKCLTSALTNRGEPSAGRKVDFRDNIGTLLAQGRRYIYIYIYI
jgi:hypothetical protein